MSASLLGLKYTTGGQLGGLAALDVGVGGWGGGQQLGSRGQDVGGRHNERKWSRNSLAGESIYTVYEVALAAIHTVGLLRVVALPGVARARR